MGEAKKRRANDALYGVRPKLGSGIVLTEDSIVLPDGRLHIKSTSIRPQELRHAVVFWDRIAWPASRGILIASGPDEQFLEGEGILTRPAPRLYLNGPAGFGHADAMIQAFTELNTAEPGLWAMSGGDDSYLKRLMQGSDQAGRGILVSMFRSIPTPKANVPLDELLEFRHRRHIEFLLLRIEVEKLYERVLSSGDAHQALITAQTEIELRARDAIRVAKESRLGFRLSDWTINLNIDTSKLVEAGAAAAIGEIIGQKVGLGGIGAIVGGAVPFMGISWIWAPTSLHSDQPFRYVTKLHKEILGPS